MEGIHRHNGLTVESTGLGEGGGLSTLKFMEAVDRYNGLTVESPDLGEAYGHVDPWGFIRNNQLK